MHAISKKTKIFAIVVLCFAAIVGLFAFFGGNKNTPAPAGANSLATTSGVPVIPGGDATTDQNIDEFSNLLSTVQSINIDTTLFQDPGYISLRDHPIILGTELIGRTNPFAVVGTDQAITTSGIVSVQTLQPGKVTKKTAELAALITLPDTNPVSVVFSYGTSDTLDAMTAPVTITHTGTMFSTISNLKSGTLYYVRASVVKGPITTDGNLMTFTTQK